MVKSMKQVLIFVSYSLFLRFSDGFKTYDIEDKRLLQSVRESCKPDAKVPATRVNTTDRLWALRAEMSRLNLDAFVVPSGDAHQSEVIDSYEKRLKWITGFSGSAGFAVITMNQAAMWTDGRYFLQAEDELDCNWLFMKQGKEHNEIIWTDWIGKNLPEGAKVGADARLTGTSDWLQWMSDFEALKLELVSLTSNPIDQVWLDGRPPRSDEPLIVHDLKYSGITWQTKVQQLRDKMSSHDLIIVTSLDEIGWLFNLRGWDIPQVPFFRSYAIVEKTSRILLYLPIDKQSQLVKVHLNSQACEGETHSEMCVEIRDYENIFEDLASLSASKHWNKILLGKSYAYSGGASYAIYQQIPEEKRSLDISPILLMKAQKNEVEMNGMIQANIRDSVAVMEFFSKLEESLAKGEHWDELKAVENINSERMKQGSIRPSFETISAYGSNGAIIHYRPTKMTNAKIGNDSLYLLDSGGQYLDGTTDVTRTFHFGNPTDFQIEAYTRVLLGAIDLAKATFTADTTDTRMDILARSHLFNVGLNYNHGTGHGIGIYGLVHESPIQVRIYAKEEHPMKEGYFFSDEPGYYEPGHFGIRLETVLRVVNRTSPYSDKGYGPFLGFEPVCLVPYEPKLINFDLFNSDQIKYFNYYNRQVREKVGPVLLKEGKKRAYDWMFVRTRPFEVNKPSATSCGTCCMHYKGIILISVITIFFSN